MNLVHVEANQIREYLQEVSQSMARVVGTLVNKDIMSKLNYFSFLILDTVKISSVF